MHPTYRAIRRRALTRMRRFCRTGRQRCQGRLYRPHTRNNPYGPMVLGRLCPLRYTPVFTGSNKMVRRIASHRRPCGRLVGRRVCPAEGARPRAPQGVKVEKDIAYVPDGDAAAAAGPVPARGGQRQAAAARRVDSRRRMVGREQGRMPGQGFRRPGLRRGERRVSLQPEGDLPGADPGLSGGHPVPAGQCQEVQHRRRPHRRVGRTRPAGTWWRCWGRRAGRRPSR